MISTDLVAALNSRMLKLMTAIITLVRTLSAAVLCLSRNLDNDGVTRHRADDLAILTLLAGKIKAARENEDVPQRQVVDVFCIHYIHIDRYTNAACVFVYLYILYT